MPHDERDATRLEALLGEVAQASTWAAVVRARGEALSILARISPSVAATIRAQVREPDWVEPEPEDVLEQISGGVTRDFKRKQRTGAAARKNLRIEASAKQELLGILRDAVGVALREPPSVPSTIGNNPASAPGQFGPWRVLPGKPLGRGGQGVTRRVERENPHQLGALKQLHQRSTELDDKALTRFDREIALTRQLAHPLILPVLDQGMDSEDRPWVVTEYIPSGSLQTNLPVLKGDLLRVLRIARDVASALAVAHENNIIHRDVKPSNILLRSLNDAVLGDFGIAHSSDLTTLTATAERVGANWYLPPEAEEGRIENPEPSFDVYSLGKVIYVCLSGGSRFHREEFREPATDLVQLLARPRLATVNNTLLSRMILADPRGRFQSMAEVLSAIDNTTDTIRRDETACRGCTTGRYEKRSQLRVVPAGKFSHATGVLNLFAAICDTCGDIDLSTRSDRPTQGTQDSQGTTA